MAVLVTQAAPDFKGQAVMPDNSFKEVSLSDYKDKYLVLFFYPLDFTFVCPSEIIAFGHRLDEFKNREVEVVGCSVDSHFSHWAWRNTAVDNGGIGQVRYPIVADITKQIARDYDVLINGAVALRGSFLIDKKGVVRHQVINDLPIGRDIDEMLRVIDALQYTEKHGEVCPAGWKKGDEAMKASLEGTAEYLAKHGDKL